MLWLLLMLLLMLLLYMEESFMEFMDSEMESRGVRKADAEPGAKLLLIIPPLVVPVNGEVEMASFDVSSSIACGRVLISLAFVLYLVLVWIYQRGWTFAVVAVTVVVVVVAVTVVVVVVAVTVAAAVHVAVADGSNERHAVQYLYYAWA